MATDAVRRAVKKYDAVNAVQFHMKLNRKTDADIIDHLQSMDNVQGYIKGLILADMSRIRCQNGSQDGERKAGNP